jgi:hypothetical protein
MGGLQFLLGGMGVTDTGASCVSLPLSCSMLRRGQLRRTLKGHEVGGFAAAVCNQKEGDC